MKLLIDTTQGVVLKKEGDSESTFPLFSTHAFELISQQWLAVGWVQKYSYSFTWLGRPVIQLPEDMVRIQELVYHVQPDLIIETGIAHGGSLVFYASLCKAMEKGRVIGVDIEIRPHNRKAIEQHRLYPLITLIEGNSTDATVVQRVKSHVQPGETVMVTLDSCHTKKHVLAELRAYGPMVSKGSYIVAMDGIMADVVGAPRTEQDWAWNNPKQAALEFVAENPDFVIAEPPFQFNEGGIQGRVTYCPCGFIKRIN